ncbi:unnamed protein product [Amoebophrya sp. A25]|nr:unnamed protein product [Amoebophrya sp. A25]|eukprot:GSA25T00018055001.1
MIENSEPQAAALLLGRRFTGTRSRSFINRKLLCWIKSKPKRITLVLHTIDNLLSAAPASDYIPRSIMESRVLVLISWTVGIFHL